MKTPENICGAAFLCALGLVSFVAGLPALLPSRGASLILTLPVTAGLLYGAWPLLHEDDDAPSDREPVS